MALFRIQEGQKEGFIDGQGKVVIPPQFGYVWPFSEGLAHIHLVDTSEDDLELTPEEEGKNHAFIDPTGRIVIKPGPPADSLPNENDWSWEFDSFADGLASFWVNDASGLGGYMDRTGTCVLPSIYKITGEFREGLACVALEDLEADNSADIGPLGFIDQQGQFVIPASSEFLPTEGFQEGLCEMSVSMNDEGETRTGFLNKLGDFQISPTYQYATGFSEGLARASLDGAREGLINKDGNPVIPFEFDHVGTTCSEDRIWVQTDRCHMLFDRQGNRVTDLDLPREARVGAFNDGFAVVDLGDSTSRFIDLDGEQAFDRSFTDAWPFEEGMARVRRGDEMAYIDTQGRAIWTTVEWEGH